MSERQDGVQPLHPADMTDDDGLVDEPVDELGDRPAPHDQLDHLAWLLRGDGVADVSPADALAGLALLAGERAKLDEFELRAIAVLRRDEVGWTTIGRALGYPHDGAMRAAIQRHGALLRQLRQVADELRDHLGRSPS